MNYDAKEIGSLAQALGKIMPHDASKIPDATGRFSVSESGMRELNASRQPWDLVKELIQHAWDEAPFATECRIVIEPRPDDDDHEWLP